MVIFRGDVQGVERELLWFECDFESGGFGECACPARQGGNIVVRLFSSRAMLRIDVSIDSDRDLRIVTYAVTRCIRVFSIVGPNYGTKVVLPPSRPEEKTC